MSTLSQTIEALYSAFADVPKPQAIEGCPHCIDDKNVDALLMTPLRELHPEHLSSYASSAFLTVGSAADYCYFLPRIVEISSTNDCWWPDIQITGRAIYSCEPDSWPRRRRDALHSVLFAVISEAIESARYDKLDQWMCGIARMGFPVSPHLDQIANESSAVLSYFEDNADSLPNGKLSNPFWELPNDSHDEIVCWFNSDPILRMRIAAYGHL
jgi:hypothetical protein